MSTLDLAPFWRRFDDTAPAHLKLGLVAATWVLGLLVPLLVHLRPFSGLEAGPRQVLLRRMERVWWTAPLVEVLKLVACLAFFFDDGVQQTVREGAKP